MRRAFLAVLALLVYAQPAQAAFTHVQFASRDGASNTSQALAYAGNVTTGSLLTSSIANKAFTAITVNAVAGSASCNVTWVADLAHSSGALHVYRAIAASTGACTVTYTLSAAATVQQMVWEASFTGGGTITVDRTCEGTTNPAALPHKCTSAVTTTQAEEYGITMSLCNNSCALAASPGGWTNTGSQSQTVGQHRVFSSTVATDGEWTSGATEFTGTVLVTYYASSGATPSSGLSLMGVGGQ